MSLPAIISEHGAWLTTASRHRDGHGIILDQGRNRVILGAS
jgi:hypothetical protein